MTIIQKQLNEIFRESQKTQEEFGKLIGVSRQTLGTYLRGDIVPDANTIQNICLQFHVSADWLLGLSDIRTTDQNFKTACATFGLSDAAGRTLAEKKGSELNSFLELPLGFWNEFLADLCLYNSFKKQMHNDTPTKIAFQDDHISMNVHAAVRYLADRLGKEVESVLYGTAREEAIKRGKS